MCYNRIKSEHLFVLWRENDEKLVNEFEILPKLRTAIIRVPQQQRYC